MQWCLEKVEILQMFKAAVYLKNFQSYCAFQLEPTFWILLKLLENQVEDNHNLFDNSI